MSSVMIVLVFGAVWLVVSTCRMGGEWGGGWGGGGGRKGPSVLGVASLTPFCSSHPVSIPLLLAPINAHNAPSFLTSSLFSPLLHPVVMAAETVGNSGSEVLPHWLTLLGLGLDFQIPLSHKNDHKHTHTSHTSIHWHTERPKISFNGIICCFRLGKQWK